MARGKCYVVTAPESIRGVHDDWETCRAAVRGVSGARYQACATREEAAALLRGEAVELAPGLHAFVDGNHLGGVGVVMVRVAGDKRHEAQERACSVEEVLERAAIAIDAAGELSRLRQILAELAALCLALMEAPEGATLQVIHDYEGVGAWMTGRWRTKDPTVRMIVARALGLATERRLTLRFKRQDSHRSSWAGRNDLIAYNNRADALARRAGEARG